MSSEETTTPQVYPELTITRQNLNSKQKVLNNIISYLCQLKTTSGKLLVENNRKTFIISFESAAKSVHGIAQYLFNNYPYINYFLTFKINQDHIETLFSKIRSNGGYNNNSDVQCFRSALRALLIKAGITPSPNANCIDLDVIAI